jgi:hypothetical protein
MLISFTMSWWLFNSCDRAESTAPVIDVRYYVYDVTLSRLMSCPCFLCFSFLFLLNTQPNTTLRLPQGYPLGSNEPDKEPH